jgi:hypothetical protein
MKYVLYVLSLLAVLFVSVTPTQANTYAVFQLTTQCVEGSINIEGWTANSCSSGDPNTGLIGTFTLDQTTGKIYSWDLFSQFTQTYFNNAGRGFPDPPSIYFDRHDSAEIISMQGEFLLHISRSWQFYFDILPGSGIHCCTYVDLHDLYLPFSGSADTFAGGQLNDDVYNFGELPPYNYIWGTAQEHNSFDAEPSDTLVTYTGDATLVRTYVPEPSALLLTLAGVLSLKLVRRRSE